MEISQSALRLIKGMYETQAFRDALDELVQCEIHRRLDVLRTAARDGNAVKAALIEGEIRAYERLPEVFKHHASRKD